MSCFALYEPEDGDDQKAWDELNECDSALFAAIAEAERNLLAYWKECKGGREKAMWMAYSKHIETVASNYAHLGATDTASRDMILDSIDWEQIEEKKLENRV
jgi:hypothetical protein